MDFNYTHLGCSKCRETKPVSEFYPARKAKGARKHGGYCKACAKAAARSHHVANPVAKKAAYDRWVENNPGRREFLARRSHLARFNLTPEQYDEMLESQGGGCAICKAPCATGNRLAVDHNHECCPGTRESCGKCRRDLLCGRCNLIVDDAVRLRAEFLAYGEKWGMLD